MITRALWLLVVGLIVTIGPARAESNGVAPQLFMPDGQLKSHSVRVYISRDLALNQQPRLRLLRSHAVTKRDVDEAARLEQASWPPGRSGPRAFTVKQCGGRGHF